MKTDETGEWIMAGIRPDQTGCLHRVGETEYFTFGLKALAGFGKQKNTASKASSTTRPQMRVLLMYRSPSNISRTADLCFIVR